MRPEISFPTPKPDRVPPKTRLLSYKGSLLRWGVAVAIVLVILVGVVAVRGLVIRHSAEGIAQLQAIAALKADQIGLWLGERRSNAEMLRTANFLSKSLSRWRDTGDPAIRDIVVEHLTSLQQTMGYQAISVIDRNGKFLLGAGGHQQMTPALSLTLERVFTTGRVQFTDLYRDSVDGKEHLHFDFVVPFVDERDYALVMRLDKGHFLFPFLQEWPLSSDSAETLLFKRDGDDVLFLNELRHRSGTALRLRIPLDEMDVLEVQVINDKVVTETPVVGVDYRGVPVVGVTRTIPGTSWYLMAKTDHEELRAELLKDLFWVGLALTLALLSVVTGAVLLRQWKKLQWMTERQLDQAEASLDIVFQSLPDLFFRIAVDGTILDYRAQSSSDLFFRPEKLVGKRLQDVLPPELGQMISTKIEQAYATRELLTYEYDLAIPEGGRRYEARLASLIGSSHLIMVVRDITERKLAEEALRESEARFRTLFEYAPDAMYLNDHEGIFVDGNRRAETMVGCSRDEIIGKSFADSGLIRQQDLPHVLGLLAKCRAGEPTGPDEVTVIQRCGKPVYTEINTFPVVIEGRPLIFGIAHDITARKQAELALRENELQFRSITSAANDAIIMTGEDERVVFWNKAAEHIFGFSQAEAMGRSLVELIIPKNLHGEYQKGYSVFRHSGAGAVIGKTVELSALRKDGRELTVDLSVSALKLHEKWLILTDFVDA